MNFKLTNHDDDDDDDDDDEVHTTEITSPGFISDS